MEVHLADGQHPELAADGDPRVQVQQRTTLNSSIPTEALTRIQAEPSLERKADLMVPPLRLKHTVKQSLLEKFELAERSFSTNSSTRSPFPDSATRRARWPCPSRGRRRSDEERDARQEELDELQAALQATPLPDKVRTRAERELKRFRQRTP